MFDLYLTHLIMTDTLEYMKLPKPITLDQSLNFKYKLLFGAFCRIVPSWSRAKLYKTKGYEQIHI
jgi:hypothetical protein